MRAIHRKLWRDLWHMRGQALAIVLLVACATMTFVGAVSTRRSLQVSRGHYYDRNRLADAWASLRRAPEDVAEEVLRIPGVAEVETRVVAEVQLSVTGFPDPVVGRLVSLPAGGGQPGMNRLHLRSGRLPEPGRAREVVAGEAFVKAHRLRPGDRVGAVIHGRRQDLTIVGVALSPEYVFQARTGAVMPDDKRFGVFWMPRDGLAAAADMDGAFDDITLRLSRGASEPAVIAAVDRVLAPYGGTGAYGRDRHMPTRYLSDEIKQLRGTAIVVPSIFLGVAAFLLNVLVGRVVATQREQVGVLKAFGWGNGAIGLHYAWMVLVMVLAGTALGIAGGVWLGRAMTAQYTIFYRLPVFEHELETWVPAVAAALSVAAGLLGVAGALARAVRLPPAEAMRPAAPASFHATPMERLGIGRLLSPAGRMVVRNLGRRPVRSLLSSLGIAFAVAILVTGMFFGDAMDAFIDVQFRLSDRSDASVAFTAPLPADAALELRRQDGVLRVEPYRAVGVRMSAGPRAAHTALLGLDPGGELRRVADGLEGPAAIPDAGVMLSRRLAQNLSVGVGDRVTVEVLEGRRPVREVTVSALADELLGTSAYTSLPALARLLDEPGSISGAFLAVDPTAEEGLWRRLREMPKVAAIGQAKAELEAFRTMSAEFLLFFASVLVVLASVIAGGVVYNAARITFAERSRELATLRVVGLTRAEVSSVLLGELAVLVALAIPMGWLIGYGLATLTAGSVESDLYRIPVVVSRASYAWSALVVVAAAVAVALLVRRRVDRLDLVSVLKTRE
ncbi:MAG: ABC transporter permease [Deltaproteobacteria bacterium]|nr:ABC transporter permease [Deltaproteobacteria bacterium]